MSFWKKGEKSLPAAASVGKNIRLAITSQAQENFSRDKLTFIVYLFCILSVLGQSSLILGSGGKLPLQIPLFYSRPWGEKMLSTPLGLWILPGIMLAVSLLNFFVISSVRRNRFLVRTIVIFTFLVAFLTIYDSGKIISLLI